MFLGVSESLTSVHEDQGLSDFAAQLSTFINATYGGNKRTAYVRAGVSPQTLERALKAMPIRGDRRIALEQMMAEESAPDTQRSTYVAAPDDGKGTGDTSLDDIMREIRQMRADIEDLKRGQGRDSGT